MTSNRSLTCSGSLRPNWLLSSARAVARLAFSEDLTQEVMLTVYRKAAQIRDRSLFRAWLFKIARNARCRQYGKQSREVETVDLENIAGRLVASSNKPAGTPAFEFHHWMTLLECTRARGLNLALCGGLGISRDRRRH